MGSGHALGVAIGGRRELGEKAREQEFYSVKSASSRDPLHVCPRHLPRTFGGPLHTCGRRLQGLQATRQTETRWTRHVLLHATRL